MTTRTPKEVTTLIADLRQIAPKQPLSYGQSLAVARAQAAHLRSWAKADRPDINLIWLIQQTVIPVNFVASHRLGEESGLTTDAISGKLELYLNRTEPAHRQRFSLLHEFKHALDFDDAAQLHAGLGSGDRKVQADQIELIANEFAAQVLMPKRLVTAAWYKTGNLSLTATLFNVSLEAMKTRLTRLGLIGGTPTPPRRYFRLSGGPRRLLDDLTGRYVREDEIAA